jgi:hypothetical protein
MERRCRAAVLRYGRVLESTREIESNEKRVVELGQRHTDHQEMAPWPALPTLHASWRRLYGRDDPPSRPSPGFLLARA